MAEVPPQNYTEYPRVPIQPRVRLEVISEAWPFLKAELGTWALATFLMMLLTVALAAPLYVLAIMQMVGKPNPDVGDILLMYAFMLPAVVLAYVGQSIGFAGMYNIAIKQVQGQPVSIKDFFHFGGTAIFSHIGAGTLIFLAVMVGSMACYLPGFIVGGLLMFTQPIIVHQKLGVFAAMGQSWNLLKEQLWMATAFYFIISLVAGLGALACGIGILFTYPLYPLAVSLVYRDYLTALYGTAEQPA